MGMAKKKAKPGRKPKPGKKPNPWRTRLRAIREHYRIAGKRMTQAEAAKQLGVSTATWTAWETGRRTPTSTATRLISITFPM